MTTFDLVHSREILCVCVKQSTNCVICFIFIGITEEKKEESEEEDDDMGFGLFE